MDPLVASLVVASAVQNATSWATKTLSMVVRLERFSSCSGPPINQDEAGDYAATQPRELDKYTEVERVVGKGAQRSGHFRVPETPPQY